MDGDGDCEIVGDFGPDGIWVWDGGSWRRLSAQNSEFMTGPIPTATPQRSWSSTSASRRLVVERRELESALCRNPEYLMAADADGDSADEILFDFGSNGLWLWNAGAGLR